MFGEKGGTTETQSSFDNKADSSENKTAPKKIWCRDLYVIRFFSVVFCGGNMRISVLGGEVSG